MNGVGNDPTGFRPISPERMAELQAQWDAELEEGYRIDFLAFGCSPDIASELASTMRGKWPNFYANWSAIRWLVSGDPHGSEPLAKDCPAERIKRGEGEAVLAELKALVV